VTGCVVGDVAWWDISSHITINSLCVLVMLTVAARRVFRSRHPSSWVICTILWSLKMVVNAEICQISCRKYVLLVVVLSYYSGVHGNTFLQTACKIAFVAVALDCSWSNLVNSVAWRKCHTQTRSNANTRVIRVCRQLLENRGYAGDTRRVREGNPSSKLMGRRVTMGHSLCKSLAL
jgi:hypothetical protein